MNFFFESADCQQSVA